MFRALVRISFAAVVLGTLASATSVEAKLFKFLAAAEEPLPPVVSVPATPAPPQAVVPQPHGPVAVPPPASYQMNVACIPAPCIKYRNAIFDCKVRCCDPCKPPVPAVLHVVNPCSCLPLDVPVCLPSCCGGEPTIECRKTLLGAGMISYKWCCGVTVNIRFDRCGDVLVTYRGT